MVLRAELKKLILKTFDSNLIKNVALKTGMVSLRHDGVLKVLAGMTTIEEVLRVTQQ
jgi:general secretion pathway protein E